MCNSKSDELKNNIVNKILVKKFCSICNKEGHNISECSQPNNIGEMIKFNK